ncbi:MAG: hypothetical protein IJM97_08375 [Clostridia bacterium]|nr:hypothetical protein [Clostridia bacterium]
MKILEKLKENKKLAIILILAVLTIVLIVASELIPKEKEEIIEEVNDIEYSYAENLETKLSTMISNINGAGNTKVLVTLKSSSESVYAYDSNVNDDKQEYKYILLKNGSTQDGLLLKMTAPEIRGVAVVCEGASSATVRKDITDMITSVLDISSNRVSVIKMK